MCVQGFCPCEEKCTNQMFTKKQYAKLEVVSPPHDACSRRMQPTRGPISERACGLTVHATDAVARAAAQVARPCSSVQLT